MASFSRLAAGVLVVAALLVLVGRWERGREIHRQVRGIERIEALVGPLDNRSLSGFRVLAGFDCLTYGRGRNPFALELCIDPAGRVVEAIDRRTTRRRIYTLRFAPSTSTVRVDRARVGRLLRRMSAS